MNVNNNKRYITTSEYIVHSVQIYKPVFVCFEIVIVQVENRQLNSEINQ